MVDHFIF